MKDKTFVCLKWGNKYSEQYVNTLYNMCKRHCSEDFDFVCLTENPLHLLPEITVKPLPASSVTGWWFKPFVFSKSLNLKGNVIFLDLDLVISSNINKLWSYNTDSDFVIIRDFVRHQISTWNKFNSSVFRFRAEKYHWIWDYFVMNQKEVLVRNRGDQDFLYTVLNNKASFWPDSWIQSYKWEMRQKNDLIVSNSKRVFKNIKQPTIHPECCIAVFHGDPKPPDCKDPWVIENWI